jgi:hypothetical protein
MTFDIEKFRDSGSNNRYSRHITALTAVNKDTTSIENTVLEALSRVSSNAANAFVIYGEPQSGKTEMMIALTAKLLDEGHRIIILLLNDSVQLLNQNLRRFRLSGLDPAPRSFSEILDPSVDVSNTHCVVFCKKNAKDLQKLIDKLGRLPAKVVIDDEADYATPNAKVNSGQRTRINELIGDLLANDGQYIGVTATPARLDLNRTFENDQADWVNFAAHSKYSGKEFFFPTRCDVSKLGYQLRLLPDTRELSTHLRTALFSYFISVAKLNSNPEQTERNYSMLIHTSGARVDHTGDYKSVIEVFNVLQNSASSKRTRFIHDIWKIANERFPGEADDLTHYVLKNINRKAVIVMNSDFDKKNSDYETATNPSTLFTIAIGGNIVSRGVTFDSLLSMFFTRDSKHKIQQDTYIQRARMFGTRQYPLTYFELTIPETLYDDWHRCFVFHTLALLSIRNQKGAPIWLGDNRINPVSPNSIDKSRLDMNTGEMSFGKFRYSAEIDTLIASGQPSLAMLDSLGQTLGDDCLPSYLIDFVKTISGDQLGTVAIHPTKPIEGYRDADTSEISRKKGLIGKSDREEARFPNAVHHFKIYTNSTQHARVFYRYDGKISTYRMTTPQKS